MTPTNTTDNKILTGLFDDLKEANNGEPLFDELKDKLLQKIDTPKNQEGYYLDAFDNPISFSGIRQLKRAYTQMKYTNEQKREIAKCQNDYFYFRENYCKIVTKNGIGRPEPRDYQLRLERALVTGDDIIAFWPRQCVSENTILEITEIKENKKISKFITIKELYTQNKKNKKLNNFIYKRKNEKIIESIKLNKNSSIFVTSKDVNKNTNIDVEILEIHKTKKLKKYKIILENGLTLEGAEDHLLITKDNKEINLINSLGEILITKKGYSKVIEVIDLNTYENMYDLSVSNIDEVYFTNGILSHNSGKSVTVSVYLLWKAMFIPNINVGIAGNVHKLALEVLDKIKKIYIQLPIWLQPGLESWNKGTIEFDNGTKILTSATSGDSFRGFSINLLFVDEVAFIHHNLWEEFSDAVFPAQDALANKQTILTSTAKGMNHWYFMVQGAKKNTKRTVQKDYILDNKLTVQEAYESKDFTYDIKDIVKENDLYTIIYHKGENGYRLEEALWTEVPRWNRDGTKKDTEVFKQEQIEKNGVLYFQQNFGNCVGYDTIVDIEKSKIKIGDLFLYKEKKIKNKKNKVLTPKGYKTFNGIAKYNKKSYKIETNLNSIITAGYHRFVVDNKEVFAKDLKIGSVLQTNKGYCVVENIEYIGYKDVYDLCNVEGSVYYTNNILSHNTFLGSSDTLIEGSILKEITPMSDNDIIRDTVFKGIKIFEEPRKDRAYIMTVDPKVDGNDKVGVHIIDVTSLPFKQVASAKLSDTYLLIPQKIYDLGEYYNNCMIVVENNMDMNIADTLYYQYEYEGEIFKEKLKKKANNNRFGVRTTKRTKKFMISTFKRFIEEGSLIINDKDTLEELFHFERKPNNTYSAEEGYTDDLVMSLILVFAPFMNVKDWSDFKGFVDLLENKKIQEENEEREIIEFLDMGFSTEMSDDVIEDNSNSFGFDMEYNQF